MRINEFQSNKESTPEQNLITALELIRYRYKDQDKLPKISTQSVINLVLNTDKTFDYDALIKANDNPAVKNIIKTFNKDYVELHSLSDVSDKTTTNTPSGSTTAPVDTVSKMAKRAAKKRNKPLVK